MIRWQREGVTLTDPGADGRLTPPRHRSLVWEALFGLTRAIAGYSGGEVAEIGRCRRAALILAVVRARGAHRDENGFTPDLEEIDDWGVGAFRQGNVKAHR